MIYSMTWSQGLHLTLHGVQSLQKDSEHAKSVVKQATIGLETNYMFIHQSNTNVFCAKFYYCETW